MELWLIYRMFKSTNFGLERIEPVEFCKTEKEAVSYSKLFNLQTPIDLRDKISHKYFYMGGYHMPISNMRNPIYEAQQEPRHPGDEDEDEADPEVLVAEERPI